MKPHEQYNCEGYYGFGIGVTIEDPSREHGIEIAEEHDVKIELDGRTMAPGFCNACPLADSCWKKHKERVAKLFPDVVAEFERMAKELSGAALMKEWFKRFRAGDPYSCVLGGNVEDGLRVAGGGLPKDRGPGTLPYPFGKVN